MKQPKLINGLPIVRKELDACLLFDVTANDVVAYAPGTFWSIGKSKALRERGTGHKVVYLGWPIHKGARR